MQAANQRIRDERRQQIDAAARRVFARKGFAAAKVADFAGEAQMSHGLIYHYYRSKDEVFIALLEESLAGALALFKAAGARPGTPWERLEWLFAMLLSEEALKGSDRFLLIIHALTSDTVPESSRALLGRYLPLIRSEMAALIRQGQAAGEVDLGDPDRLTLGLMALVQGIVISGLWAGTDPAAFPDSKVLLRMLKA